ncbi:MAG: LysM peptidoglycan-binding domain-containing protein [Chloroflexi bacterium]|nr:LysM peptidoglycan-binding domain-containing protein [Chloroflexota bacterium]
MQPGDTLATIALEHGTTIEALAQANKLDDPSRLSIGQRLSIPP